MEKKSGASIFTRLVLVSFCALFLIYGVMAWLIVRNTNATRDVFIASRHAQASAFAEDLSRQLNALYVQESNLVHHQAVRILAYGLYGATTEVSAHPLGDALLQDIAPSRPWWKKRSSAFRRRQSGSHRWALVPGILRASEKERRGLEPDGDGQGGRVCASPTRSCTSQRGLRAGHGQSTSISAGRPWATRCGSSRTIWERRLVIFRRRSACISGKRAGERGYLPDSKLRGAWLPEPAPPASTTRRSTGSSRRILGSSARSPCCGVVFVGCCWRSGN